MKKYICDACGREIRNADNFVFATFYSKKDNEKLAFRVGTGPKTDPHRTYEEHEIIFPEDVHFHMGCFQRVCRVVKETDYFKGEWAVCD